MLSWYTEGQPWQADEDFLRVRHRVMHQTLQVTTVLNCLCANLSYVDTHKKGAEKQSVSAGAYDTLRPVQTSPIHCSGIQYLPYVHSGKKQTDVHLSKLESSSELCPAPSCEVYLLGLWFDS